MKTEGALYAAALELAVRSGAKLAQDLGQVPRVECSEQRRTERLAAKKNACPKPSAIERLFTSAHR